MSEAKPNAPLEEGTSWQKAYEARRQEALNRSNGASSQPLIVPKLTSAAPSTSPLASQTEPEKTGGLNAVPGVTRPLQESQEPSTQGLSNSKRKKLEEIELKKNGVEELVKKAVVDKSKTSEDWASEYEARKAAALSKLTSNSGDVQVGSMSAFHAGPYGQNDEEDRSQSPRPENSMFHQNVSESKESFCTSYDETSVDSFDETPSTGKKPPLSPLELLKMEKQNPKQALSSAKERSSLTVNAQQSVLPSVSRSSSSNEKEKSKKLSMEAMIRQVKSDSKRSSENWQQEYQARKMARLEEEKQRVSSQKLIHSFGNPSRDQHPNQTHSFSSMNNRQTNPNFSQRSAFPKNVPRQSAQNIPSHRNVAPPPRYEPRQHAPPHRNAPSQSATSPFSVPPQNESSIFSQGPQSHSYPPPMKHSSNSNRHGPGRGGYQPHNKSAHFNSGHGFRGRGQAHCIRTQSHNPSWRCLSNNRGGQGRRQISSRGQFRGRPGYSRF